jgi:hypothetical protein
LHNLRSNVYAKRWGEAQEMRANYGENLRKTIRSVNSPRSQRKFRLHPTQLEFSLVQDIWFCQRGEKEAFTDQSSNQGQ